jgi:L-threonylcarbamoyladenylate synthase
MSAPLLRTGLASAPPEVLDLLVSTWRAGGVVIYPTDTLYGIGGLPTPAIADRIAGLKGREPGRPFPLLAASAEQLASHGVILPAAARTLAERFWPGPLTLVLRLAEGSPLRDLAHEGTVGVRVPAAPYLLAALELLGSPVIGTSANPSGYAGAVSGMQLADWFGEVVELILLSDEPPAGAASAVVSFAGATPEILREGPLPELSGALRKL